MYSAELILNPHTDNESQECGVFATMRDLAIWVMRHRPYGGGFTDCYINGRKYRVIHGVLHFIDGHGKEHPVTWWRVGGKLMSYDEYMLWRDKNGWTATPVAEINESHCEILEFKRV